MTDKQVPPPPKRPLNPYMKFAQEIRAEVVKRNPKFKVTEISREIADEYKKLGEQEMDRRKAAYGQEKEHHKKALEDYVAKHGEIPGKAAKDKRRGHSSSKEEERREKPAKGGKQDKNGGRAASSDKGKARGTTQDKGGKDKGGAKPKSKDVKTRRPTSESGDTDNDRTLSKDKKRGAKGANGANPKPAKDEKRKENNKEAQDDRDEGKKTGPGRKKNA